MKHVLCAVVYVGAVAVAWTFSELAAVIVAGVGGVVLQASAVLITERSPSDG